MEEEVFILKNGTILLARKIDTIELLMEETARKAIESYMNGKIHTADSAEPDVEQYYNHPFYMDGSQGEDEEK